MYPAPFFIGPSGKVASLPERDPGEASRILRKKAEEDATAVREFAANQEIPDSIIGFHAQQAVEKWLKTGIEITLDRGRLPELTQYAVPLRYDELLGAESLEREALVVLVDEVDTWATAQLGSSRE